MQQRIEAMVVVVIWVIFGALLLGGCATTHKSVSIACFADEEARKAKRGVEGQFPIVISDGTVLFYDSDGTLHRVRHAVCGLKGEDE